jgi:hypothetical protein
MASIVGVISQPPALPCKRLCSGRVCLWPDRPRNCRRGRKIPGGCKPSAAAPVLGVGIGVAEVEVEVHGYIVVVCTTLPEVDAHVDG